MNRVDPFARWVWLKPDVLLAEFPSIEMEGLADALERLTDLREMLAEIIRSAPDDEALVAALSHMSFGHEGPDGAVRGAQRKCELALKAMSEVRSPNSTAADFTASLRQGAPTLDVVEEAKIPAAY